MSGIGIIMSIILGGLAGWIAEMITKADHGLLTNIALGITGAFVLNFLLGLVDISVAETWLAQLVVGTAGACLLIFGYRAVRD